MTRRRSDRPRPFRCAASPGATGRLALLLAAIAFVAGPAVADPVAQAHLEAAGALPSEEELLRFAGRWDQVADEHAEAERIANIDAALADLSWIVRKMAAGVLHTSAAPPPEVQFAWDGHRLAQLLAVDGETLVRRIDLAGTVGAATAERPPDPDPEARWAWRDGRLEVEWTRDQARGATRFRYDPTDDSLHVAYEIHVTALDGVAPIHYGTRFERRSPPTVSAAPGSVRVSGIVPTSESTAD